VNALRHGANKELAHLFPAVADNPSARIKRKKYLLVAWDATIPNKDAREAPWKRNRKLRISNDHIGFRHGKAVILGPISKRQAPIAAFLTEVFRAITKLVRRKLSA
jgi:hypothetical protein